MDRPAFYLFGAPRLVRDERLVEVDTRKAIALLAYLALTGKQQSRDTLAALLWSDYSQTNARAALRRTLSALHKALGFTLLEADREVLYLPADSGLWVDVKAFESSLKQCETHGHTSNQVCPQCLPWLEEAARLYQGHFMAGFTLRDSLEFDDWQFQQGELLRRELAGVLERLVAGYSAQHEFDPAIRHAQRWLALDSLHEPAHRHLMKLYTAAGMRSTALRQYQECVRVLDKELGVTPLEETNQLYLEIKEQGGRFRARAAREQQRAGTITQDGMVGIAAAISSRAMPSSSSEPTTIPVARLPFIGREGEWMALQQIYASIQRDGFFAVLEGEAGIGKTRLAEEFLAYVRSLGARTISARCYPGEAQLAYAPFVEGLTNALNHLAAANQISREDWHQNIPSQWLGEAVRLLPELSRLRGGIPQPAPIESPGAQTRFFEGLGQVILALCGAQPPGVLFFDNLEWADEASLDLLNYLVRRLDGRPMLILATWREEDLEPGHRLRGLLAEAQRVERGELIPLSRLPINMVAKMVQAYIPAGGDVPLAFSQRLFQETEGLPFFVAEYLAALPEKAAITSQDDWAIPHSVRDLLHSRLDKVGETGWQLLQAAAVIGRSFDFDALREVSGRSDEETISTLEKLVARGLIREIRSGESEQDLDSLRLLDYDFSHEKLRSLVYVETSLPRRRLLHQRTAETLVARARGRHDLPALAGQIAHHYRLGGRAKESAEYHRLAGDHARALYANAEARSHYQSALALGHPDTAELNEAIGDMNTLLANYTAAIQSYELAMAQLASNPLATARVAHRLGDIYHRLGDWDQAEGYFQAGIDALKAEGDRGTQARLYADWSRTAHQRGQTERAQEMAQQALALAETANDRPALTQAHNVLGILARSQGDLPTATWHLERSLTFAEEMSQPAARIAALNNLSLVYAAELNLDHAIRTAVQALDLCIQLGDRHREAALHNNLADLYHAANREAESMEHLKQAVVIFAEVGSGDASEASASARTHPEIWKLTEW